MAEVATTERITTTIADDGRDAATDGIISRKRINLSKNPQSSLDIADTGEGRLGTNGFHCEVRRFVCRSAFAHFVA
jgi:hypothetical protein